MRGAQTRGWQALDKLGCLVDVRLHVVELHPRALCCAAKVSQRNRERGPLAPGRAARNHEAKPFTKACSTRTRCSRSSPRLLFAPLLESPAPGQGVAGAAGGRRFARRSISPAR